MPGNGCFNQLPPLFYEQEPADHEIGDLGGHNDIGGEV